ncbi:glycoside hydrolase superfamily [Dichotomocladium elegans]|nr:glycoside hydrolase superfamily [Dichotomocladium elegans]
MELPSLIKLIKDFKSSMVKAGYPHIPVATTEIRELKQLIPIEDMVLDNVHPFFAGTLVEDAANWTWQYFYDVDQYPTMQLARELAKGQVQAKPAIISEIGWPTGPKGEAVQAAVPSLKNLDILLNTFVCAANRRQVPYYWFEFRDQPWKISRFNETREAYWGLFDKDRKLKAVQMPKCRADSWQPGNYYIPQPAPLGTLE